MTEYYIIERTPGNAFTTFTDSRGEVVRVPLRDHRIGPFTSVTDAADRLSEIAIPHASYEIESVAPAR